MKKIIIITGQTATGKTALGLELAQKYNGEIVNADARQVYKYFNIVTGKDIDSSNFTETQTVADFSIGYHVHKQTKIWLYDIVKPNQYFSAHDYNICCVTVIKNLLSENKVPILVGGSYFYLSYLLYQNSEIEIEPDWNLRKELEKLSVSELIKMLTELDIHVYNQMNESDRLNPRRIIRKIELIKTKTELAPVTKETYILNKKLDVADIEIEFIGMKHQSREELQKSIEKRTDKRLEQGAVVEVKNLIEIGYSQIDPGMNTIGYKQLYEYIQNTISLEEAKSIWINKELQYAKRQYTFMKKDPNIIWRTSP